MSEVTRKPAPSPDFSDSTDAFWGRCRKRRKSYAEPRSTRLKQLEAPQSYEGWCPSEVHLRQASGNSSKSRQDRVVLPFSDDFSEFCSDPNTGLGKNRALSGIEPDKHRTP